MLIFYLAATILSVLCSSIRLQSTNSQLDSPDWIITNCPIASITNTTQTIPYQYIDVDDLSSGLMRLFFNYTPGAFPQGMATIRILQTEVEHFRVDGYEDLKIDLSVSLAEGAQTIAYDSYLEVNYNYRQSNTALNFKVHYWRGPTATCQSNRVTLSGIPFGFRKVQGNQFALEVCQPSPTKMDFTFDLTELDRYVLSLEFLRVWDIRKEVKVHLRAQGAGEIALKQKAYYLERVQYLFVQQKSFAGYTMANQPFFREWNKSDFINLSLPVNGSTKGIISEAYFTSPKNVTIVGHHWILIGLFFSNWTTKIHSYGIPAEVHTDVNVFVNFGFTPQPPAAPAGRAACFLLNFRDDFDPVKQNFTNTNKYYLSSQFIIVVWASETYYQSYGPSFMSLIYYGVNWKVSRSKMNFLIQAQTNLAEVKNFDVFAFVRYLENNIQIFSQREHLVTIQTGFRYNAGRGRFVVKELQYKTKLEPFERTIEKEVESVDLVRSSISTAVESVISVSFIGIIVRLSPLISLVDELAMYAYHRPKYDSGFSYLSELFLDWTKGKWVPPFCDPIAAELAKAPIYGQTVRQPNKFGQFGLYNNFFRNTSNFVVLSLPFNMLTFLLLRGLSWLLRRFQILTPVHKPVRPFRTFATFFSTAFVENMTYLSFHSFLHLSKFVPYSHGRNIFPSCIFCLLLFFTALMTALCLAPAAWLLSRKFFKIEYCKVNFKSYLFFTFAAIGKLCSGFFHAYIDDAKYRIFGLFAVNVCVFAVLLFCCKAMQCKTYLIIYLGLYFGKVVLHLQLFQEIWVSEILTSMPDTTTQNSFILVILIFGLMFIIFLANKAKCLYDNITSLTTQLKQDQDAAKVAQTIFPEKQPQTSSQPIKNFCNTEQWTTVIIKKNKTAQGNTKSEKKKNNTINSLKIQQKTQKDCQQQIKKQKKKHHTFNTQKKYKQIKIGLQKGKNELIIIKEKNREHSLANIESKSEKLQIVKNSKKKHIQKEQDLEMMLC